MQNIPLNELQFSFTHASGPGGQNVNKVASKVQLRWRIGNSLVFSDEEKRRLRQELTSRITQEDELQIDVSETRSQSRNRELAVERLQEIVKVALTPKKKRLPTKPSRGTKERRLEEKRQIGEKKKSRRVSKEDMV